MLMTLPPCIFVLFALTVFLPPSLPPDLLPSTGLMPNEEEPID
jgi:hypothetical protein